jgi:3-phosphoshikimate 1-carboxyvinyltransferase
VTIKLVSSSSNLQSKIIVGGSKSETNRLLLLQALYPSIKIENASVADDSEIMLRALQSNLQVIDVHHAGTAMRFLAAYFSIQEGRNVVLTGSSRMKERPIKALVDALVSLGADIEYLENEGFPPIKIKGKNLTKNTVSIPANFSSQYISALLLISPKLENGLELTLVGEITSFSYIKMTLSLLNKVGVETLFYENKIVVKPKSKIENPQTILVESDWSSASYYYSIIALSKSGTQITLSAYKENSFQGDSDLVEIYRKMGVETQFDNNQITLIKQSDFKQEAIKLDLNNTPDIAQTIIATCLGLGVGCDLTGLHTLKIKETDRLEALQNELTKLGAKCQITNASIILEPTNTILPNCIIATYNDHRMAMSFAPLALKVPIEIENPGVVSKSYPNFWEDLERIGIQSQE